MGAFIRRAIDLSASVLGLALLALPFALVGLLIKLDSAGPVFFRQDRAGKDGRTFRVWKFRTMVDGSVNLGLGNTLVHDDDRITRVGRFLRQLSIDELPQLINVVTGDMSLVGPRPTLPYQVERYSPWQRRRLAVKPGITSWAGVNGRNRLAWAQRIELDVWYVENRSVWLDLKIIARTFWVAFITREGVYADDGPNDDFSGAPVMARIEEQAEKTV